MVMEASRAEYLANDKSKQQLGFRESSTSGAEPSSSGASKFFLCMLDPVLESFLSNIPMHLFHEVKYSSVLFSL